MGQKTQTLRIGDHSYTVTQLPAWRATEVWYGLVSTAGPGVARILAGAFTGANSGREADMMELSAGIGALFDRLPWPTFKKLLEELLATATLDGGSTQVLSQFDTLFQGDVMGVLQLGKFAIEVNYGNFTEALRNLAAAGAGALSTQRASPSVSSSPKA